MELNSNFRLSIIIPMYNVIFNRSQNVLFGIFSISKQEELAYVGINSAIIAELKKENLYPMHGKFDSAKKSYSLGLS